MTYVAYMNKNCRGILMIAIFFDPIAGFTLVTSQIWMGKKISNNIKIPTAAFLEVELKNKPIPNRSSMPPKI